MKKKNVFLMGVAGLIFVVFTVLVRLVDRAAIGPEESVVGFAKVNGAFHELTGVNMGLYNLTDAISLVPFGVVAAFALIGLIQWVRRKKIMRVDGTIRALGVFYVLVFVAYALFELVKINYRPVLIEGKLETSYPSSTTMLAMAVFASAMMVVPRYLRGWKLRLAEGVFGVMMGFMVTVRLISGVHWLTDIIGGILLSVFLLVVLANLLKMKAFAENEKPGKRA